MNPDIIIGLLALAVVIASASALVLYLISETEEEKKEVAASSPAAALMQRIERRIRQLELQPHLSREEAEEFSELIARRNRLAKADA